MDFIYIMMTLENEMFIEISAENFFFLVGCKDLKSKAGRIDDIQLTFPI